MQTYVKNNPQSECHVFKHPLICNALSQNEKLPALKLAGKSHQKRARKSLDKLYEVLAPSTKPLIDKKNARKIEYTIWNSDIANFGMKG